MEKWRFFALMANTMFFILDVKMLYDNWYSSQGPVIGQNLTLECPVPVDSHLIGPFCMKDEAIIPSRTDDTTLEESEWTTEDTIRLCVAAVGHLMLRIWDYYFEDGGGRGTAEDEHHMQEPFTPPQPSGKFKYASSELPVIINEAFVSTVPLTPVPKDGNTTTSIFKGDHHGNPFQTSAKVILSDSPSSIDSIDPPSESGKKPSSSSWSSMSRRFSSLYKDVLFHNHEQATTSSPKKSSVVGWSQEPSIGKDEMKLDDPSGKPAESSTIIRQKSSVSKPVLSSK